MGGPIAPVQGLKIHCLLWWGYVPAAIPLDTPALFKALTRRHSRSGQMPCLSANFRHSRITAIALPQRSSNRRRVASKDHLGQTFHLSLSMRIEFSIIPQSCKVGEIFHENCGLMVMTAKIRHYDQRDPRLLDPHALVGPLPYADRRTAVFLYRHATLVT